MTNLNSNESERAIRIGRWIQVSLPQVVEDYRNGLSASEIKEIYGIDLRCHISGRVATNAVMYALRGYSGELGIPSYDGLITDHEFDEIENKRKPKRRSTQKMTLKEISRKGGYATYEMGVGIHAQTPKERSEAGKKGGQKTYEENKGVHAFTSEEISKIIIERGHTLWKQKVTTGTYRGLSEIEIAYRLSQLPDYRKGSRVSNKKIAEKLNEILHDSEPIRTRISVEHALLRFRKKLEKEAEGAR